MSIPDILLRQEKSTWIEHTIKYDTIVKDANLAILNNWRNGTQIYLCYSNMTKYSFPYTHWFITDKTYFLEFNLVTYDIQDCRVTINTLVRTYNYHEKHSTVMDDQIRERMKLVLGMCNYSFCLRNCEHVANYVFRGAWYSTQMNNRLGGLFANSLGLYWNLVNIPPLQLQLTVDINETRIYTFTENHFTFSRIDYYLDKAEDTFNVLVLGPPESRKSHLINVLFNFRIFQTSISHEYVTKDVVFVRGKGNIYDSSIKDYRERQVIVADTIGLCNTEWSHKDVIDMIKGKICYNMNKIDLVFVVFKVDGLTKDVANNISKIFEWLNYYKYEMKFVFVCTYSGDLSEDSKNIQRKSMEQIWELNQRVDGPMYVTFPPEDGLNETAKEEVLESWLPVNQALVSPEMEDRIPLLMPRRACAIL